MRVTPEDSVDPHRAPYSSVRREVAERLLETGLALVIVSGFLVAAWLLDARVCT